ncbi:MAG: nucleotidyltransferase [Bacteroidota bacterium]
MVGSLLRPKDFGPSSDIDWIFDFDRPSIPDDDFLDHFDAFWAGLEQITGRRADLIHYPSLRNPYFRTELDTTKVLIYDHQGEKVSV